MAQDPGPPGWPQVPQGPVADGASPLFDCAANTDSFFSSSLLAQRSQLGVSAARTSVSNSWPQARQAYSKIGMARFYRQPPPGFFVISSTRRLISFGATSSVCVATYQTWPYGSSMVPA